MSTKQGIYQIYNGQIVNMRHEGYSLKQIGNKFGVTRERIRQILVKHYDNTNIPFFSEVKMGSLIGCNPIRLKYLREKGIVSPKRLGYKFLYSYNDIEIVKNALIRFCKHCGVLIPPNCTNRKYCQMCSKEKRRYSYPFFSKDEKKKFHRLVYSWRKRNPERLKVIQLRASRRHLIKVREQHYSKTEYLIVKCSMLPIGSIFKAIGCDKKSHLITKDGLKIPISCVRKLK